jgi:hypothetical protein
MDFGCGDVAAGIRLAHTVYQISCVYENRAGMKTLPSLELLLHGY